MSTTSEDIEQSESLRPLQRVASTVNLPICTKKRRTQHVKNCLTTSSCLALHGVTFWRAVVAECIATFFYVFFSLLPTSTMELKGNGPYVWGHSEVMRCALAFGLSRGVLAYSFGGLSGCQLNPIITISLVVSRKMDLTRGFIFIVAQFGGSLAGSALLLGISPSRTHAHLGVLELQPGFDPSQGLALEILMAFLLVFTFYATLDSRRSGSKGTDAMALGFVELLLHIIGIPLTGAGINPARALGSAFTKNFWSNHWIYWFGPCLGGLLAGLLYTYVFYPSTSQTLLSEKDDIPTEPPPCTPNQTRHPVRTFAIPRRHNLSFKERGSGNNTYEIVAALKGPRRQSCTLVKLSEDDTDEDGYITAIV